MTKYYTIPGYGGSDSKHWQTYFDEKLTNCQRIDQDNWMQPDLIDWVERIEETLKDENLAEIILITHSLGGIALLQWVVKYGKKIKGALIVAPPDIENPYEDLGLGDNLQIPHIQLPFPSIVVGSSNDHWMTKERTEFFADAWGSELMMLQKAGHINGEAGFGVWEEGLKILKKFD